MFVNRRDNLLECFYNAFTRSEGGNINLSSYKGVLCINKIVCLLFQNGFTTYNSFVYN